MARVPRRPASGTDRSKGFLDQLGKGLQAAGSKTRQLGKLGLAKGELEREKLALNSAYSKLGEAVSESWIAEPGAAVVDQDPRFAEHVADIETCHTKIADIEKRIESIRREGWSTYFSRTR